MNIIKMGYEIGINGVGMEFEVSSKWRGGRLVEPFKVLWREHEITVPAGFETDFATIPRALWWFATPLGKHAPAAVVHDWLYSIAGELPDGEITRADADKCFLDLMEQLNVGNTKRNIMYQAVRMFGWLGWSKEKK